jgi:hypothetical protein
MTLPAGNSPMILPNAVAEQLIQNTKVHLNLGQDAIIITEDKVRLCLIRHSERISESNSWIAPIGVFLTILITLVTTEFKPFIFDAAVWKAIFVICGFMSGGWLIKSCLRSWRPPSIDDVVLEMKRVGSITASPLPPKERESP